MGFHLEIAAFRGDTVADIDRYLPDVFGYTGAHASFEEATSVEMAGDLAAVSLGDYAIVLDPSCRLTGIQNIHDAVGTKMASAIVARISDEPIVQIYDQHAMTSERVGADEIISHISPETPTKDGEDAAITAFAKLTGITFPFDLFDMKFRIYRLD